MSASVRVRRHPIKGIFAGLFLGLGAAIMLVIYKVIAFGTNTPYVIVIAGIVVGLAMSLFAPPRGGRRAARATQAVEPAAAPAPEATMPGDWTPTHTVSANGVTTYAGSEEGGAENGTIAAGADVQVLEQQGDWARVKGVDGREAWVDSRELQART